MCPRCGSIRYAREGHKTARCFECGYQIPLDLNKIRIMARVENSKEAIAAVQGLKMRHGKKDFE